ncbi:MAG: hypothetical protein ABI867_28120 [Kofleriaceae bacterium]
MLRVLAILALTASPAFAELRHDDAERVRPELVTMTVVTTAGKVTSRETRAYDATGHITRHEHHDGTGTLIVAYDYAWDAQGRMLSRTYRDNTKRVEVRTFTYTLDAKGRIAERVMHDPTKDPKELIRYEYTWEPSGRHTEQSYRHYPKEGPYRSSSEIYDAANRLERSCFEHGGCSMYEYDTHGNVDRVREQNTESHHYRSYENTYDTGGMLTRRIEGNSDSTYRWNTRGDVAEIVTKTIASQGGAPQRKQVFTYRYR